MPALLSKSTDPVTQKIAALVLNGIERDLVGLHDDDDVVDAIVKKQMEQVPEATKSFMRRQIGLFRAMPESTQRRALGKYYNRRMIVREATPELGVRRRAIPVDYLVYERPLFSASNMSEMPVVTRGPLGDLWDTVAPSPEAIAMELAEHAHEHKQEFYKTVTLEMDAIYVIEEDDPGRAEPIVVGGAADGLGNVHAVVTGKKSLGAGETAYFTEHRVAVPNWPLAADGTSKIVFGARVWELDVTENRQELLDLIGGIAALIQLIMNACLEKGVFEPIVVTVVEAIVEAICLVIAIVVWCNSDDKWGYHEVRLSGPFEKPQDTHFSFYQEAHPKEGVRYRLSFVRSLGE